MNYKTLLKYYLLMLIVLASNGFKAQDSSTKLFSISDYTEVVSNDSDHVFIDVRKIEKYNRGHIPNAINILRRNIVDSTKVYSGIITSRENMQQLLSSLGIKSSNKIIIYDDKGSCESARLWWILKTYGHQNAYLLDGGYDSYKNANNKISQDILSRESSNYLFPSEENFDYYASLEDVKTAREDSNTILLDTRTIDEYLGNVQKSGAYRKGRIPASINLDWASSVNYEGDKKFKSIVDLRVLFESLGITKDKKVIAYCQSGVRSAHTTFVLTQLMGYPNVKNYDGSWIEWSYNKSLPIDSGKSITNTEVNELLEIEYSNLFFNSFSSYANYLWSEITFHARPWYTNYFWWLIVLSIFVWVLELVFPWRKNQPKIRADFWIDTFYMFFNFFIFNLIIFIAFCNLTAQLFLDLFGGNFPNLALINIQEYPEWLQLLIFFVATDFVQWFTHVILHRFDFLWRFHKVHHSVEQMGFAAHLRYHWMENVFYTPMKYIMVMLIGGFHPEQAFIIYYLAIAIGHLNHANIGLNYGPLKFIFNSAKMHIWHHAYELPLNRSHGVNFGISLSIWDYIFRTNYIPHSGRDIRLGFEKIERFPKTFFKQLITGFKD
jgi:3-mercaptopyruvate sulfurtransferase SseA/sterol desaturase/sphingolipid hydroxylase (fatty acid hydroxylase superfamily)